MRTISATEARIHFGEVMRRAVTEQEPTIVERAGKPHVVIISIAQYERLKAAQKANVGWQELVNRARQKIAEELGGRTLPPPEEVIRTMREERDAQLLDMR